MADSLAPEVLTPFLRGRFGHPFRYRTACPSTQRLLDEQDPEGAIAATEVQTEGRGRLGRIWHAPPQTSILVSVLLRPPVEPSLLPELSPTAGRAVAEAIHDQTGLRATVKFPNDVLIDGKKVAGILAEADEHRVVLGIGVNVNQSVDELPADAQPEATSLRLELGRDVNRAQLLAAILERLEGAYDGWLREAKRTADVSGGVGR